MWASVIWASQQDSKIGRHHGGATARMPLSPSTKTSRASAAVAATSAIPSISRIPKSTSSLSIGWASSLARSRSNLRMPGTPTRPRPSACTAYGATARASDMRNCRGSLISRSRPWPNYLRSSARDDRRRRGMPVLPSLPRGATPLDMFASVDCPWQEAPRAIPAAAAAGA
jgi:hypothetical protein